MTLTDWVNMVKRLGCNKSKYAISNKIKEECLFSNKKYFGMYSVNGQAVWDKLINNDEHCKEYLNEKNISDYFQLEAFNEEIKYREFWGANRIAYRKKRR